VRLLVIVLFPGMQNEIEEITGRIGKKSKSSVPVFAVREAEEKSGQA